MDCLQSVRPEAERECPLIHWLDTPPCPLPGGSVNVAAEKPRFTHYLLRELRLDAEEGMEENTGNFSTTKFFRYPSLWGDAEITRGSVFSSSTHDFEPWVQTVLRDSDQTPQTPEHKTTSLYPEKSCRSETQCPFLHHCVLSPCSVAPQGSNHSTY